MRKTKIICTLGPAVDNEDMIRSLIRTGMEQYRDTNQDIYQNNGAFVAPSAGRYLSEEFPNLKVIGMDRSFI